MPARVRPLCSRRPHRDGDTRLIQPLFSGKRHKKTTTGRLNSKLKRWQGRHFDGLPIQLACSLEGRRSAGRRRALLETCTPCPCRPLARHLHRGSNAGRTRTGGGSASSAATASAMARPACRQLVFVTTQRLVWRARLPLQGQTRNEPVAPQGMLWQQCWTKCSITFLRVARKLRPFSFPA